MQAELDTAKAELAATKEELRVSSQQSEELEGQVSGIQTKMTDLNSQLASISQSRDAAQSELDSLRSKLSNAESQLSNAFSKIEELREGNLLSEDALLQERQKAEGIAATLQSDLDSGGVANASVGVRNDNTIGIRVASGSLFRTGSSNLSESGQNVLAIVGSKVSSFTDYDIRVEGHTDNVPIGPVLARTFKSNWELSVARAASTVRYLSGNGVDASRLSAVGYGEFNPIADNESVEGREQNRRVEVVLHPR